MYRSLVLAGLAVIQVVGAVPIDAAETATNYQNVTMDDGTVMPVQLPPGITFVPQPDHSEPTPGLTKRVGWFPGNNAICQPAHDYEMEESTDDDSPWEEDCAKIIDKAQDPRNQVGFPLSSAVVARPDAQMRTNMFCSSLFFLAPGVLHGTLRPRL